MYVVGGTDEAPTTAFIRKFDPLGEPLWHDRLSSSLPVLATGVAANSEGVVLSGTGGDLSGGPASDPEGFVRGYDTDGGALFTTYLSTSGSTEATGVAASGDAVFVGGDTDGMFPGQWLHSDRDEFVARAA